MYQAVMGTSVDIHILLVGTYYGFQLWFYNKALLSYLLKELNKMQRRAATWILGIFCTLPSFSIEAIMGLIPIHLHLQKLSSRSQLRAHSLLYNYILKSLLKSRQLFTNISHQLSLNAFTPNQHSKIKEPIVNMNNRFNKVFSSFNPFNKEFASGSQLIDIFFLVSFLFIYQPNKAIITSKLVFVSLTI